MRDLPRRHSPDLGPESGKHIGHQGPGSLMCPLMVLIQHQNPIWQARVYPTSFSICSLSSFNFVELAMVYARRPDVSRVWSRLGGCVTAPVGKGCCYRPTLEFDDVLSLVSGLQHKGSKMIEKLLNTANPTRFYAALPGRPEDRAGL